VASPSPPPESNADCAPNVRAFKPLYHTRPLPMPAGLCTRLLAIPHVLLASSTAMAIEEPSFRVLERDGAYELREYAPYLVAETRVKADFERAGNEAFRRLLGSP